MQRKGGNGCSRRELGEKRRKEHGHRGDDGVFFFCCPTSRSVGRPPPPAWFPCSWRPVLRARRQERRGCGPGRRNYLGSALAALRRVGHLGARSGLAPARGPGTGGFLVASQRLLGSPASPFSTCLVSDQMPLSGVSKRPAPLGEQSASTGQQSPRHEIGAKSQRHRT